MVNIIFGRKIIKEKHFFVNKYNTCAGAVTLSDDAYIFWFIGFCFVLFGVPNRRHNSLCVPYVYRAYNMYKYYVGCTALQRVVYLLR